MLCQWCRNELERDLVEISDRLPWLDALSTAVRDASAAAPSEVVARSSAPAEHVPFHAAALVADEARVALGFYVHVVVDERGLRTPQRAPSPAEDLGAWLLPHLDWLAGQEFAHDLRAELARLAALVRRFPGPGDVEPARPLDVPCPRCDQIAVWETPPRRAGQQVRVECTNPDCARVYSEDEWARLSGGSAA